MKKIILLSALIFLASCQTLGTLGETFQLIEEDPRAPIDLDTSYDSFSDKKWSKEIPEYDIAIDGVKFKGLSKEQYELLYRLKGST